MDKVPARLVHAVAWLVEKCSGRHIWKDGIPHGYLRVRVQGRPPQRVFLFSHARFSGIFRPIKLLTCNNLKECPLDALSSTDRPSLATSWSQWTQHSNVIPFFFSHYPISILDNQASGAQGAASTCLLIPIFTWPQPETFPEGNNMMPPFWQFYEYENYGSRGKEHKSERPECFSNLEVLFFIGDMLHLYLHSR